MSRHAHTITAFAYRIQGSGGQGACIAVQSVLQEHGLCGYTQWASTEWQFECLSDLEMEQISDLLGDLNQRFKVTVMFSPSLKFGPSVPTGAGLKGAGLSGANLSNTDLHQVDLSQANLAESVLVGANLRQAVLAGADLSGADLSEADLSEADLREANLSAARLDRSVMSRADLSRAILTQAVLDDADLDGAIVTQEQLADARSLRDCSCGRVAIAPNSQ
jgi:uncharacterized protein YjbI with pentapeptide repeats